MTALARWSFNPWVAGLVDVGDVSNVQPDRAALQVLNMTPEDDLSLRKRGGYRAIERFQFQTRRVAGLFTFRLGSRPNDELIVITRDQQSGDQDHRILGPGVSATLTTLGGTGSGRITAVPSYLALGDTLLIAPGDSGVVQWDLEAGGRPIHGFPAGGILGYHNFRVYVAGLQNAPDSVQFSAPGLIREFEPFKGGGIIQIPSAGGEGVTAIAEPYYNRLYVFTRWTISELRVASESDVSVERVSSTIGCVAHHAVTQVGNDLFFVSERGVHSLLTTQKFGDVETTYLSAPIQRIWDRIDVDRLNEAWATYWPQKHLYMLCMPFRGLQGIHGPLAAGSTYYGLENNKILVFHVPTQRWAVWDWPASCIDIMESYRTPGHPIPVVGGHGIDAANPGWGWIDGHDYFDLPIVLASTDEYEEVADEMRVYPFEIETHAIDAGDSGITKRFARLVLFFKSGAWANLKVQYVVDDKFTKDAVAGKLYDEATVYLNPDRGPLVDSSNGANNAGGETILGSEYYPMGQTRTVSMAVVDLGVTGHTIRFKLTASNPHPFTLYGWELWGKAQSPMFQRERRALDGPQAGTLVEYEAPAARPAPEGGTEVGDGVEVG